MQPTPRAAIPRAQREAVERSKQARVQADATERDRRLLAVPPSAWTIDDVCHWLAKVDLSNLQPAFRQHRVQGQVLATLTPADYDAVGVTVFGDRRLLQAEHAKLFPPVPTPNAVTPKPAPPPLAAPKPVASSAYTSLTPATSAGWMIPRAKIQLGPELNRGNFGVVFRGVYDGTASRRRCCTAIWRRATCSLQ